MRSLLPSKLGAWVVCEEQYSVRSVRGASSVVACFLDGCLNGPKGLLRHVTISTDTGTRRPCTTELGQSFNVSDTGI